MGDSASRTGHEVPIVSLGIPVYNGERYVGEAIRSALGQSLDDIEIVISDATTRGGVQTPLLAMAALRCQR